MNHGMDSVDDLEAGLTRSKTHVLLSSHQPGRTQPAVDGPPCHPGGLPCSKDAQEQSRNPAHGSDQLRTVGQKVHSSIA